jgi:hypothetical protein
MPLKPYPVRSGVYSVAAEPDICNQLEGDGHRGGLQLEGAGPPRRAALTLFRMAADSSYVPYLPTVSR